MIAAGQKDPSRWQRGKPLVQVVDLAGPLREKSEVTAMNKKITRRDVQFSVKFVRIGRDNDLDGRFLF